MTGRIVATAMDDLFLNRPVRIYYDGFGVFGEDESSENGFVMSRHGSDWMVQWDCGVTWEVDSRELIDMMCAHEDNRLDPKFPHALVDTKFEKCLARDVESASTSPSTNAVDSGVVALWRNMPSDDMDADGAQGSMESEVEIMDTSESTVEPPERFRLYRARKICGDTAAFLMQWREEHPDYTACDLEKMCKQNNLHHTARQIRKWYGNQSRRVRTLPTPDQRKQYEETRKKNMNVEQKEAKRINARRLRANMSPEQREREVLRDRKRRKRKDKRIQLRLHTAQEMVLAQSMGSWASGAHGAALVADQFENLAHDITTKTDF